jgi:hypothetical protein
LCAGAAQSSVDLGPAGKAPPPNDPLLAPFLHVPTYASMVLSPDGKHIAAVGFNASGINSAIAMIDADTLDGNLIVQPRLWRVKGYQPYIRNPRAVSWLSDTKIAVNFTIADAAIFGIDGTPGTDLMQGYLHPLRDAEGKPTPWHLVLRDSASREFARLDIETGKDQSYDLDVSGKPSSWASDGSGEIRVVQTIDTAFWTDHSRIITWYRPSVGAGWVKVDDRSVVDDPFNPLFVPNRPGKPRRAGAQRRRQAGDLELRRRASKRSWTSPRRDRGHRRRAGRQRPNDFKRGRDRRAQAADDWFDAAYGTCRRPSTRALPGHVNIIQPTSQARAGDYVLGRRPRQVPAAGRRRCR